MKTGAGLSCLHWGVEVLVNELVRRNKPFQLMSYPNRSHSINEAATPHCTCAS